MCVIDIIQHDDGQKLREALEYELYAGGERAKCTRAKQMSWSRR